VTLEVFDASGRRVRKLSSVARPQLYPEDDPDEPMKKPEPELSADAGLHRAVWNLRWDGASRIPDAKIDSGDTDQAPRAVPGRYRLKLTAAGRSVESTVEVLPDPRSTATQSDLEAQLAYVLEIRDALNRVAGDVETVRAIRTQASDLATRLTGDARGTDLVPLARRLADRCTELEAELHNPNAKVVYDILAQRGGTRLHSNLVFLYASAMSGDGAPTQGEREVFAELERKIAELEAKLAEIQAGDLAELERQADALKLPHVLLKRPIESEDL
jgi:hypothetical protein